MAAGLSKTHPITAALLAEIGFEEDDVTQAWGSAKASAGFHEPEGRIGGKRYSSCFDLAWRSVTKVRRDRLVAAGICVFPRDWAGNQHHHCVHVGLTDDNGQCRILSGPRAQIRDFFNGRSGLAGHGAWVGKWRPTCAEAKAIEGNYASWVPDYSTEVTMLGVRVPCFAWLEKRTIVSCEVRPLVECIGARILDATTYGLTIVGASGQRQAISLTEAYLSGEFLRAPVRAVAKALWYGVEFEWAPGKASCSVKLIPAGGA